MLLSGAGTTGDDGREYGKEPDAQNPSSTPVCDSMPKADQRHADSLSKVGNAV
jgi:hypothetical protein